MPQHKNLISIFYIAMALISVCLDEGLAYRGIIPASEDSPGKCMYRDEELKLGVNFSNSPCQRLICLEDGSIDVEGCGKVRIENCNRGERMNPQKTYPECCWFKYKCKNSDGSTYYIERNMAENADAA